MRRDNVRTCKTCGAVYKYCNHCGVDENKPVWMMLVDTEACLETFYTATDFNAGTITKEQAKKKIEESGMDISKAVGSVGETVKKIFEEEKKEIPEQKVAINKLQNDFKKVEYRNNKHRNDR